MSYARQHEPCACDVKELEWYPQSGASLRQPMAERAVRLRAVDGRRARRVHNGAPVRWECAFHPDARAIVAEETLRDDGSYAYSGRPG